MSSMDDPVVFTVSRDSEHRFSKHNADAITLLAGLGVEGDAHAGVTVQHLYRLKRDPEAANLRQVHLMMAEVQDAVRGLGYDVEAGQLGENVTTRGIDLLGLPRGTLLRLGEDAVVEVTGLRSPCSQINDFRPGLMRELVEKADDGRVLRKAGVMSVVLTGGEVRPGDPITVTLPAAPHHQLEPV